MNNKQRQNLGWCPNDAKPKDLVPMISYKWKKGMSLDRTQKGPNDEKRVEQINELR